MIEKRRWLPCELKVFTINGKKADRDDFGDIRMLDGSAFDCECGCEFFRKPCTREVLDKYGITESEYDDICNELWIESYVGSCGCCS